MIQSAQLFGHYLKGVRLVVGDRCAGLFMVK